MAQEELEIMHKRTCFRAISVKELTRQERVRSQEGLIILIQKQCGLVKGMIAYNGKATNYWITKEDKSSPTVLTDCIKLTAAINTCEGHDIILLDVRNTFIQMAMPEKEDECGIMKIQG